MSCQYCHECNTGIDTDFNAEHFEFPCTGCGKNTTCVNKEQCDGCEGEE